MAEAIVINLAENILRTLESPEITCFWGSKSDISGEKRWVRELKSKLDLLGDKVRALKEKLPAAEALQTSSYLVRVWLGKVRDLLLETDDLLDEIAFFRPDESDKDPQRKKEKNILLVKVQHLRRQSFNPLASSSRGRAVDKIIGSLGYIATKMPQVYLEADENVAKQTYSESLDITGRKAEIKQILEMLDDHSDPGNISTIAIVGLAGVGKTALAQEIFNHENVKSYVPRIWACVSGLEDHESILMKITESATNRMVDKNSLLDQVRNQLIDKIRDKRYLLILDDMWTLNDREWNNLKGLLNEGSKGSKIILTTRSEHVAKVSMFKSYMLHGLSDEDSMSLLHKMAAVLAEVSMNPDFEHIKKDIVRRCENIPLIIRLVANLLHQKNLNKWLEFRDEKSDIMEMLSRSKNEEVLDVLKPSYNQLQPRVKDCLAFCSLFPRGYEFRKHDLIQLWIAEGFVEPSSMEGYSLEDVGDDYFQELLRMCFFQDVKRDALDDVISCRIHNMVHHLAQQVAGVGNIITSSDFTKFDDKTVHASVRFGGSFHEPLSRAHKMRTLLLFREPTYVENLSKSDQSMLISKFRRLRSLDLHDCSIDTLPNNLCDLIHLRYLDLSKNDSLVTLPNSITKLHNLQTLKLNFCQNLQRLPKEIGKLGSLRCLEIEECESLTYMPSGLGKLTSLQSLNRFVVCKSDLSDDSCGGMRVLNRLNNLRRRLKIELSGQWATFVQEAPEANLASKNKLSDLKIEWKLEGSDDTHICYHYGALLEGLKPPSGLKALCIEGYKGKDFPSWLRKNELTTSLPNLVIISIEGCTECKHVPPFGLLKSLKRLTLRNMERVEYVDNGVYDPSLPSTSFFPSLEVLTLHSFYNLKGWWKEVRATQKHESLPLFKKLKTLKVWNCPKLACMPLIPEVVEVDFENVNRRLFDVPQANATASGSSSAISPSSVASSSTPYAPVDRAYSHSHARSFIPLSNGLLQNLGKLERLHIKVCPDMKTFPAIGHVGVKFLSIDRCHSLTSMEQGLQHLTSLEELELSHCQELNCLEDVKCITWGSFKSLHSLTFRDIPKMKSLPEGLRKVETLKFLWIASCSAFSELPSWLNTISSLKHLRIEACPLLTSLPQKINRLQKLNKLEIMECPRLMERCREPNGEDWPKIKDIKQRCILQSWRYGLMNDLKRSSETAESQPFEDVAQKQGARRRRMLAKLTK